MTQGPSVVTGQDDGGQSAAADPAAAEAYRILRSRINLSVLPPLTRAVTEAVVCATADFDYVTDLVCNETALAAGVSALKCGAPVVADSAMVAAGLDGCAVICKAAEPLTARLARTAGIGVAAAGVRLGFAESGPGAVWVVGTAPGAIHEILRRFTHPALVIGVPVGLDGAATAKDALRMSGVPCLSNMSEKGGPAVAAAAFGALLRIAAGAGGMATGAGGNAPRN
jgi:precorrin-8X/cobalt-precorrin-8 methylmutase